MANFLTVEDSLQLAAGIFNGILMRNVQFFRRRADIWIVKDGPVSNPFFCKRWTSTEKVF